MRCTGEKFRKNIGALVLAFAVSANPLAVWGAGPGDAGGTSGSLGPGGPGAYVDAAGNVVPGVIEKGISVSKYQNRACEGRGGIDWQRVKGSGVGFVMVRMGYHNDLDPYYHANMVGAAQAGLKTGVFFYTQALDTATAVDEANFVLSQIRDYPVAYPVAYDLESKLLLDAGLTRQQITDQAKAFCRVIARAGYRPMVYANQEWLNSHVDASQLRDETGQPYDIWYARYGTAHEYPNRTIWQCTNSGRVDGIEGDVTIEYAFADYGSLIPAEGWKMAGGEWYYVRGYQNQTGWLDLGDQRYYLGSDGKMAHDVTMEIDGAEWVFGADGAVVR